MGVVYHVSNPQHRQDLIEKTVQKYGHIGIVVSNAAANPSVDNILDAKESVRDKLWEINVKSSVPILQAAASYLKKGSSVILISSSTGYLLQSSMAMYGVTKTAPQAKRKTIVEKTLVKRLGTTEVMTSAAAFLASDDSSNIPGETLVAAGGMPSRL